MSTLAHINHIGYMRFDSPVQTTLNILVSVGWIATAADILRRPSAQFTEAKLNKWWTLFICGSWWPLFPLVESVPLPIGLFYYGGYVLPRLHAGNGHSQPNTVT